MKTKLINLPLAAPLKGSYWANPAYVTQVEPHFVVPSGGSPVLVPHQCKVHVMAFTGYVGTNVTTWIIGLSPDETAKLLNR